jgi:hypothetical protein
MPVLWGNGPQKNEAAVDQFEGCVLQSTGRNSTLQAGP